MHNQKGFSALILVIVIGSASLLMSQGATWLSLRELDMSLDSSFAKQSFYHSESCLEDALLRLQIDKNFSSSSHSIHSDNCVCEFSTTDIVNAKIINSQAECDRYFLETETEVSTQNSLKINYSKLK